MTEYSKQDRKGAWELYVSLNTRVTTQGLIDGNGVEHAALESIKGIFPEIRSLLLRYGLKGPEFSRAAFTILNRQIRPFTAKWHKLSMNGGFTDAEKCQEFRSDLKSLQERLVLSRVALAEIIGFDDLVMNPHENGVTKEFSD